MSDIARGTVGWRSGFRTTRPVIRWLSCPRGLTLPCVAVAVTITACGRGPNIAPVSGLVTLDGKPVAGAAVLFMPVEGGVPARAATKDDGSFALTTFEEKDGALVGRHRVAVSKVETTGATAGADGLSGKLDGRRMRATSVTPERYGAPATSGLEATVKRGGKNSFEFRLTSE